MGEEGRLWRSPPIGISPSGRLRRLQLQAPGVQQRLGVSAGLLFALEYQVQRRAVGVAGVKFSGHGLVDVGHLEAAYAMVHPATT